MKKKRMLSEVPALILILLVVLAVSGCSSPEGTHTYHHIQPGSGQALQGAGELLYQSTGRNASSKQYNNGMRTAGALGTLLDYTSQ